MFFEEKLEEIRIALDQINEEENVLVWGTGRHTDELLKYTNLLLCHNLMFTSQDNMETTYFGRRVISKSELDLKKIDCIVISSCKFQSEIEQEIKNDGFNKKIIKFYKREEEGEFFRLPHRDNRDAYYIQGNYSTWEEAKNAGGGYDDENILKKVYDATLKVIKGNAAYERDSVVFYEPEYTFHLLTLVGILCGQKDIINIVDVGGSLGSLYWQNKDILYEYRKKIIWKVVEQPSYAQCGREKIQNDTISFYEDLDEIENGDIIIFSGVLQYVENYTVLLKKAVNLNPRYILVDRIFIANNGRIAVQYVDEKICKSSYPVRIFEEEEILYFMKGYRVKAKFPSFVGNDFYVEGEKVGYRCMIFEKSNCCQ